VRVLVKRVDPADPKVMREAGDTLRNRIGSGIIVLGGEKDQKATLMVMVTKDLTARFHAGRIVDQLALAINGRGGGREDMAQAGGPKVEAIDEALQGIFPLVEAG
jgi:alanyl-tRNA synthetase